MRKSQGGSIPGWDASQYPGLGEATAPSQPISAEILALLREPLAEGDHLATEITQAASATHKFFLKYDRRPADLQLHDIGKVYLSGETGNWHRWTAAGWEVLTTEFINVLDYGVARNNPLIDCTAALQALVSLMMSNTVPCKTLLFPRGDYFISDTIVLVGVAMGEFGINIRGASRGGTRLICNMNKPLLRLNAPSLATYQNPGYIRDICLINKNTGSAACVIDASSSGRLHINSVDIFVNNVGVIGTEIISATFENIYMAPENPYILSGNRIRKGFSIFGRNCSFVSVVVFSADLGFNVHGGGNTFYACDAEFSKAIFGLGGDVQGVGNTNIISCHNESSDVFLTNAEVIPFGPTDTTPWADNGSAGSPVFGAINVIGCLVYFDRAVTNPIVIKGGSPGFSFILNITGCSFSHANSLISGSFTPGDLAALPSGTKINISSTFNLRSAKPPIDNNSQYVQMGSEAVAEINNLTVNQLSLGANHALIPFSGAATRKVPMWIGGTYCYVLAVLP